MLRSIRNAALGACSQRRSASIASNSGPLAANAALNVFDTQTKRRQRDRSVLNNPEFSRLTDYLKDEVAAIMVDRLLVRSSAFCHKFWMAEKCIGY